MKYLSVCSGIEAATVAWHPLGWQAAAFSEIEPFPRAVLAHHYPAVPLHGDFTTIGENDYGAIDLLVGGTPCQDFSVAGLRQGITGNRGNLTLEFIRLAARKKPRWLVWENVPGILSIDRGGAFGAFLGGLAECGYGFAYRVLDAQYFGVPQRRRRVFVVGYLGDWRLAAAVLFERESLFRNIAPRREKRERIAPTISARTKGGGGLGTDFDLDGGLIAHTLRGEGFDASEDGQGRGNPLVPEIAWTLQDRDHKGADSNTKQGHLIPCIPINTQMGLRGETSNRIKDGIGIGNSGDPAFTLRAQHGHAIAIPIQDKATRYKGGGDSRKDDGSANGFGIGEDGDPFPTLGAHDIHAVASFKPGQSAKSRSIGYNENIAPSIEAGGGGNNQPAIMTGMQVRRLTPTECERLQGFPDGYTLIPIKKRMAADGPRYKALGNSMAVPVMAWIGDRIQKIEGLL